MITGCKTIGPHRLVEDRFDYNRAYYNSQNRELLLNIVRLRYDHPPVILEVDGLSSSASFSRTGVLAGSLTKASNPFSRTIVGSPTYGMTYVDNPIINYQALSGSDFYRSFLAPIHLRSIALLLNSSWNIKRLFSVTIQRMGDAVNAAHAARPTSGYAPSYKSFTDFLTILRRFQIEDALVSRFDDKSETLELILDDRVHLTSKERQAIKRAGITMWHHRILFSTERRSNTNHVITRSALGMMHYLSKGVRVPKEHIDFKIANKTSRKDGRPFDWQYVLKGIMNIRASKNYPKYPMVVIPFLDRWYYIDERDNNSKQTIVMLTNLLGFLSGSVDKRPPVGLTRTA